MGRFVSVSRPKYALTSIRDLFKKKETEKLIKEKSYLGSGAMTLPPYIPYSGFVPGQTIQITIELDNSSNVDVDYIRIRVERIWKIKANTSSKSKKSNIVKKVMVLNRVEKHTPITLMVQIQIPKRQIILNFKYCGILTDPFTLHVETCSTLFSVKLILDPRYVQQNEEVYYSLNDLHTKIRVVPVSTK